jgi:hypothetical protein
MSAVDILVTRRCQATVAAIAVRVKGSGEKEAGTKSGRATPLVVEICCFEHGFCLADRREHDLAHSLIY